MSRPLRIQYPGALYHITARGNAKKRIYLSNDDYQMFLAVFANVAKRYNWVCYAYCLMPNHYHLLIKTVDPNLSLGMRQLNGSYTQNFNIKHKRVGHLFQGRFKSVLVENEHYLYQLIRYIILNPVKAKLVKTLSQWPWSSHRGMLDLSKTNEYFSKKDALLVFDSNPDKAKEVYVGHVKEKISENEVWADLKGGLVLGSYKFLESIKQLLKEKDSALEIPKKERFANRPELGKLFVNSKLSKKERNELIAKAFIEYGYTLTEIGRHLEMHYTSVSKIVKKWKK